MKSTERTQLRKCLVVCPLVLGIVILLSGQAAAIPMLGVAPSSGGLYFGEYEDYLAYFVGDDGFRAGQDGFSMVGNGGDVTVWFGSDSGFGGSPPPYHIYLLTTADMDFTYNGIASEFYSGEKVAGYFPGAGGGYNGVDLGSPQGSGWTLAPEDSPFSDGSKKEFYFYSGVLSYNESSFELGKDWMFAVSDIDGNGNPVNCEYKFSPQTTSASNAPEPASMLLLGSGLIGLAGLRRKKLRKG